MKKLLTSAAIIAAIVVPAVAAQHLVQKGDTMSGVAHENKMRLNHLVELNPQVKNINLIYPNDKLNLGDETSSSSETKSNKKAAAAAVAGTGTAATAATASKKEAAEPAKSEKKAEEKKEAVASKKECNACDNVINGNPMYRPGAGHFYSVTSLESDTSFKPYSLNEEFGYGITSWLSAFIDTTASTSDSFKEDTFGWDNFGGGLSARFLDMGNWKGDAYGKFHSITVGDDWWHEDQNAYMWTAGTKMGYSSCQFTLNGLFEYNYGTAQGAFDFGMAGVKQYRAGIEGQYVLNADWNIVANVIYEMPEFVDNFFTGKLGVNYNITKDMYVGAYAKQGMDEKAEHLEDETTLGLQFGIDF